MNFLDTRVQLLKSCERYARHNLSQLTNVENVFPPESVDKEYLYEAIGGYRDDTKIHSWVAMQYTLLYNHILAFNEGARTKDYKKICASSCDKDDFTRNEIRVSSATKPSYYIDYRYVSPSRMNHRLNELINLLLHMMIVECRVPRFSSKWHKYQLQNGYNFSCDDTRSSAVGVYQKLMHLKTLIEFTTTTTLDKPAHDLVDVLNKALPVYIGYAKYCAVQELIAPLESARLTDKDAVDKMASQLKDKRFVEILAYDRQSQTENILKLLAVSLIAVGIGIIPTVFLATKRFYDTGGSSINFFKPLTKNLTEEIEGLTASMDNRIQ